MSSETCERDTLRTILCYLHIAKKSCREDNVLRSIQLAENTAQSRLTRLTDREREAQSPSQSPRLTHSATLSSARGSPRSTSGIRSQSSSTLTKGVPNQKKITRKPPTPRSPQQGAAGSTRSRSSNSLSQPTASSARRTVAAQRAPVTVPDIRAQHVRSPLSSTPFSDPFAEDGRTVTSVMIGGRLVQMGGGPPVSSPERTRTPRKLQRSTSNTVSSVSMKRETRSTNAGMGSFARASIDRKSPRGQRILEQLQRQTSQSGTSPSKPKKTTHQDELAQPVDASDKSGSHVQEKERDVGSKGSGILSPPQSSDPEKRKGDDGRVDNAGEVAKSWSTGSCNLEDIWDEI